MAAKKYIIDSRGMYRQTFVDERHLGGTVTVHTEQNLAPLVDHARFIGDMPKPGVDLRHAGIVPDIYMDDILREARKEATINGKFDIEAHTDAVKRKVRAFLNNPEFRKFRTWPGRL